MLEEKGRGMYRVHRLLFDLRRDDALVERFAADPDAVVDTYRLVGDQARSIRERDVAALAATGVNPYLLYFGAIRMGLTRDQYYGALRGSTPSGGR